MSMEFRRPTGLQPGRQRGAVARSASALRVLVEGKQYTFGELAGLAGITTDSMRRRYHRLRGAGEPVTLQELTAEPACQHPRRDVPA